MHKQQTQKHVIDIIFLIALLGLFAICAVLVLILGIRIYRNITMQMNSNYDTRTAFAYITEKIEQADTLDAISVTDFGDGCALQIDQTINRESYTTYIYTYEGNLCELLVRSGKKLSPRAGQALFACNTFEINESSDSLYHVSIGIEDEDPLSIYISTHCTE